MKATMRNALAPVVALSSFVTGAAAADVAQCVGPGACGGVVLGIALLPAAAFLLFLVIVKRVLQRTGWSLADALSESEPVKAPDGTLLRDAAGNPIFARSSSRFIAFIGFFAIILWIVGVSVPALYRLACTGTVPDLGNVSTFLLAQAGIFAPYVANKLAGAIKS